MPERKIRVRAVRRAEVDIDKFVAGLLQLLRERAESDERTAGDGDAEESAA